MERTIKLHNLDGVDIGERVWTNGEIAKLYGPYSNGLKLSASDAKKVLTLSDLSSDDQAAIVNTLAR